MPRNIAGTEWKGQYIVFCAWHAGDSIVMRRMGDGMRWLRYGWVTWKGNIWCIV